MTRKRFIKLLMSYGVGRNEANVRADEERRSKAYEKAFHDLNWWLLARSISRYKQPHNLAKDVSESVLYGMTRLGISAKELELLPSCYEYIGAPYAPEKRPDMGEEGFFWVMSTLCKGPPFIVGGRYAESPGYPHSASGQGPMPILPWP